MLKKTLTLILAPFFVSMGAMATLPALADHTGACSPTEVIWKFPFPRANEGEEAQEAEDAAAIHFFFLNSRETKHRYCFGQRLALMPHPLDDVEIVIDGYHISVPQKCLKGATWPIYGVSMRADEPDVVMFVTSGSATGSAYWRRLEISADTNPNGSELRRKLGIPPVDCSSYDIKPRQQN